MRIWTEKKDWIVVCEKCRRVNILEDEWQKTNEDFLNRMRVLGFDIKWTKCNDCKRKES